MSPHRAAGNDSDLSARLHIRVDAILQSPLPVALERIAAETTLAVLIQSLSVASDDRMDAICRRIESLRKPADAADDLVTIIPAAAGEPCEMLPPPPKSRRRKYDGQISYRMPNGAFVLDVDSQAKLAEITAIETELNHLILGPSQYACQPQYALGYAIAAYLKEVRGEKARILANEIEMAQRSVA